MTETLKAVEEVQVEEVKVEESNEQQPEEKKTVNLDSLYKALNIMGNIKVPASLSSTVGMPIENSMCLIQQFIQEVAEVKGATER